MEHFSPLATTFSRPIQFGSDRFQSAALEVHLGKEATATVYIYRTTLIECRGGMLYINTSDFTSDIDPYSILTVF